MMKICARFVLQISIIILLNETVVHGTDSSKDIFDELVSNLLLAYDNTTTFEDNFYALQSTICPESTFCPEHIHSTSDLVSFLLDNSTESYKWIFHNKSSGIVEARRNLITQSTHMKGCCKACSCKDTCTERRNCCPTLRLNNRNTTGKPNKPIVVQECVYSSIKQYLNKRFQAPPEFYGHSYYMVVDCFLTNYTTERTQKKCRQPEAKYPDQITPVYSLNTDRTYRNTFCAQCNNDTNVTSWKLQIIKIVNPELIQDFPSDPLSLYHSILNTQRFNDIIFVPPKQLKLKAEDPVCINYPGTLRKPAECRSTHLQIHDQANFVRDACAKYEHTYRYGHVLFGNSLCYICSSSFLSKADSVCDSFDSGRHGLQEFTAILSFYSPNTPETSSEKNLTSRQQCGCDFFDSRENACRRLHCPFGETAAECTCKDFVKTMSGLPLRVYIELTSLEPIEISEGASTEKFVQAINQLASKCFNTKVFHSTVVLVMQDNGLSNGNQFKFHILCVVSVKYGYNGKEEMEEMFKKLQTGLHLRLKGKPVTLSLGQTYTVYTTKSRDIQILNNNGTMFLTNSSIVFFGWTDSSRLIRSIVLNKLFFCMRINLHDDENDQLLDLTTAKGYDPVWLNYIYRKDDRSICIDDYMKIFINSSSSACKHMMTSHLLGWCTSLFVVLCRLP